MPYCINADRLGLFHGILNVIGACLDTEARFQRFAANAEKQEERNNRSWMMMSPPAGDSTA
ncbi:hypothetical protein DDY07_22160 [Methylomonas sp. ZR1]|nr:hypothetical protein [Methylomonas sp. ZR1]